MTDINEPAPPTPPAPGTPTSPEAPGAASPALSPRRSRWQRWRRRLLLVGGAVLLAAILVRVFLHLLLPPIISQVAGQFGFEIAYRRLDLVMLGGDFAIWDVVLKPLDGRNELVRADYAFVNVDTFETLRQRRVHILRLEADSVKLDVVRKADGSIPLLDQFMRGAAVSLEESRSTDAPSTSPTDALPDVVPNRAPDEAADSDGKPLDFTIPIVVDAVRFNGVRLDVLDESVSPQFKESVSVDLSVSRVGTEGTPAQLDLAVWTNSLLDRLELRGWFEVHGTSATGALTLDIRGLRPEHAAGYLSLLGLRADGRALDIRGAGEVRLHANSTRPGTVSGTASLGDLAITAGGASAASLKTLSIDIGELSPSGLWLKRVDARDGAVVARRDGDGSLGFASIRTAGRAPSTPAGSHRDSGSSNSDRPEAARAPRPSASPSSFVIRIDEITAASLVAAFNDAAVVPETTLSADLADLRIANVVSSGPASTETTLLARLRLPGIAESARIEGVARPFAPEPAGKLAVVVDSIRPERLEPYLRDAKLRSLLESGRLACEMIASVNTDGPDPLISVSLRNLQFVDRGDTLLDMPEIGVVGLRLADGIALDRVTVRGPSLTFRTLPGGRLQFPGLLFDPALPATPRPPGAIPIAETTRPDVAGPRLPKLRIGQLAWEAGILRFEDGVTEGVEPLILSGARFELHDLVLDTAGDAVVGSKPGRISGRLKVDGLIESLTLDGTLTPGPRSLAVALTVSGERLRLARLAPYLAPLGLEPTWTDARLDFAADAEIRELDDGLQLAGNVRNLKLASESETYLETTQLGVDRLALRDGGVEIGHVTVNRPLLRAARDEEGRLTVAGIRLVPVKAAAPVAPAAAAAVVPAAAAPVAPATNDDLFTALRAIGPVSLQSLDAVGVTLIGSDRAVAPPVEFRLSLDANINQVSLNRGDDGVATFRVELAAERLLRTTTIEGQCQLGESSLEGSVNLRCNGLNLASVAAYFPEGIAPALGDGALQVSLNGKLQRHPEAGYRASLAVRDLAFRDGERTLAGFDRFDFAADRLDLVGEVIAIEQIALANLQVDLARAKDGSIDALGVRLGVPPDAAAPLPAAPAPKAAPVARAEPAAEADMQALVARGRSTLPLIAVDSLDLGLRRISFTDRMRPQAAPVAIVDLRLRSAAPIRLLGKTPKDNPPIAIAVDGSIDPLVRRFELQASATPFADRASLNMTLSALGIDGAAINRVVPELNGVLDGATLVDGRFGTKISAEARVKRSGPTSVDFSRGLDADFAISNTRFTLGENGVVLAGVESVSGRGVRIDPRTGNVLARSVEVDGLEANLWLDEKGLNVLGVAIAMPADKATTQAGPAAATPAPPAAPTREGVAEVQPRAESIRSTPGAEVQIDSLTISGLQFRFEDRTVNPPTVIPVTALDADIRGLSSLATVANRPVRFDISLAAGKVSLPKPLRGGVLTGALSDMQAQSRGEFAAEREMEERDFFAQVAARGEMTLYPSPRGRAVAAVNGLELAAIRGLAARTGIAISEGTFDGRFDLKSRDNGDLDAKAKLVVTDLQVADSPDAAVQRYLSLPAPLDSVIGLVQAADGSITLPIGFTIREGNVNVSEIIASGVGAVSQVLVTAVASAPVKMVTGVASLFGDVKGSVQAVEDEPLLLPLDAGVVALPPDANRKLLAVLEEAARNKNMVVDIQHQLGSDEVQLSIRRANPSPQQAAALASQLRQQRAELLSRRDVALAAAVAHASGLATLANEDPVLTLRSVQSELASVEQSFDFVFDLLRPGADRDASRRARAAALSLANARLQSVRSLVETVTGKAAAERVRVGVARFNPSGDAASHLVVKVVRRVQVP